MWLNQWGADSPLQNGAMEIYNAKLTVHTRTLLFGSGLPAKYWSSALVHAVYLHNLLMHTVTQKTPFEAFFGAQPDLSSLKLFGWRVCVKHSGSCHSKLDHHDFKSIFLGYTATDQNIVYLDLNLGVVKSSHHAQFDEAWYLQSTRPPAAQLLYDLGILPNDDTLVGNSHDIDSSCSAYAPPGSISIVTVPWLPIYKTGHFSKPWSIPDHNRHIHLPLRMLTEEPPHPSPARAARVMPSAGRNLAVELVTKFKIGIQNMMMIYMSHDPYHEAFEQTIDLQNFDLSKHATGGLSLYDWDGRVHLASILPGTPAARLHGWRARLRGAWFVKVGEATIASIDDVVHAFEWLRETACPNVTLLVSHPEVRPNLSQDGIPIVSSAPFSQLTHAQLNNRWEFSMVAEHLHTCKPSHKLMNSGNVLNIVTRVIRLTQGKLLKQPDWNKWQSSEYLQLDQYDAQRMFGQPVPIVKNMSLFHSVWTYAIKALDSHKKARWACDGSPHSGQAKILDKTYVNCVDQTSSRLFYAISAAENLLIYGADVSNTFAEAPPPKQGFIFILTGHSGNGGCITRSDPQYPTVM